MAVTDQQTEVRGILATRLQQELDALDGLLARDLVELNRLLSAKGLTVIADAPAGP